MAIGTEILDVPFADMVSNMATAIAEGQLALDRSSIETLKFLLANYVSIVPEVTEIVEPTSGSAQLSDGRTVDYTSARVRSSGAQPVTLNLLQLGIQPTFYQFTEASIEVKISVSMRRSSEQSTNGSLRAYAAAVNFRTASMYSYAAQGSSVLRATLKPVPPPPRVQPQIVTVNGLVNPPTVAISG